jgi:DNA polymerase-4
MDAFFASVEVLDRPELAGKPIAVAGTSRRSVVAAASYEIRTFGVRSAMSAVLAKKLCPQGIFVPPRFSRYREISRRVMAVLAEFSPLVEQASVDEAYLDLTGCERLFGPPAEIGAAIKRRVFTATGLTCSVGLAPVRFLAKIASDFRKPDGLTVVRPEDVQDFLRGLPVGRIPGVGKRALEELAALGVRRVADVLRFPERFWVERFGERGAWLYGRCQGRGSATIEPEAPAKSASAENTFEQDTRDTAELKRWLLLQSERVARDLRRYCVAGRTVTLTVKWADFKRITRSRTLAEPVCDTASVFEAACALLDELSLVKDVRLIGVGVSGFKPQAWQPGLLPGRDLKRRRDLDSAVDRVRERFGKGAIKRAAIADMD